MLLTTATTFSNFCLKALYPAAMKAIFMQNLFQQKAATKLVLVTFIKILADLQNSFASRKRNKFAI